jgi:hypothetical protein
MRWLYDAISMEANIERSTPNTTIDHVNQRAWLHLNRKAQGLMAHAFRDQSQVDAIAITGKTGWMTLDGKDDLSQFEFHFIQLAKNNVDQTMYAGFRSSEGSVELNLAIPPAWPAKYTKRFCLDSEATDMPFSDPRRPDEVLKMPGKALASVTVSTYDHPTSTFPLHVRNRKTNADNYLLRAIRDNEFLTAFVIRNTAKQISILAHLTWHVVWKFNYRWKDGECLGGWSLSGTTFTAERAVKGPPTDASLAAMITKPNMELSEIDNAMMRQAREGALGEDGSGGGPGFIERTSWPSDVPSTFVTFS